MNGVVGLDYGAVIQFAGLTALTPKGADLLSAVLPAVEIAIVKGFRQGEDE